MNGDLNRLRGRLVVAVVILAIALLALLRVPTRDLDLARLLARAHLEAGGHLLPWSVCIVLVAVGATSATRRLRRRRPEPEEVAPSWLRSSTRRPRLAPIALGNSSQPQLVLAHQPRSPNAVARAREAEDDEAQGEQAIRVYVLGPLRISGARHERRGIRTTALELVAYLALHPKGCSRDELLEALWPNGDPKKTRHRLYQATRDARRLLGEAAISNEHDHYRLDRAQVEVDLDELEHQLHELRQAKPDEREPARLEEALSLFGGEPLAGSDYPWAASEMQRLRLIQTDLWAKLAEARLARGEAQGALDASVRGIERDPLNERLWRTALEAEGALGMRDAVEQRYNDLRQLLDERLGLEPGSETRSLYRRLLGQT
jgi:DNA-binding SARP family transcriptional activator